MQTVKWGLIGCGDVTEVKNGPGLYKCRDSELLGVTNRTLAKAHDWVRRHGHGTFFQNAEELLACPEIDIVYVATTPDTHKRFALLCAEAGKHCLLEKPIAPRYEDALEIQAAFEKAGKKVFVAHYRRALPRIQKIQTLLESLAPLTYARLLRTGSQPASGWRTLDETAGGGVFFETDVHLVDLLDFLCGPFEDVTFVANETNVAVAAFGRNRLLFSGMWHYASAENLDVCEIAGTGGLVRFPAMGDGNAVLHRAGLPPEEIALPTVEHVGQPLEQSIVDELLGRGHCPSTLASAMRSLRICRDVEDSIKAG